jgi:hypothetical protein
MADNDPTHLNSARVVSVRSSFGHVTTARDEAKIRLIDRLRIIIKSQLNMYRDQNLAGNDPSFREISAPKPKIENFTHRFNLDTDGV